MNDLEEFISTYFDLYHNQKLPMVEIERLLNMDREEIMTKVRHYIKVYKLEKELNNDNI